jgi:hypothetical protein
MGFFVYFSKDGATFSENRDVRTAKVVQIFEQQNKKFLFVSNDGINFDPNPLYQDTAIKIQLLDVETKENKAINISQDGKTFPPTPIYNGPGIGFQIDYLPNNNRVVYISQDGKTFPPTPIYNGPGVVFQIAPAIIQPMPPVATTTITTDDGNTFIITITKKDDGTSGPQIPPPNTQKLKISNINASSDDGNIPGNVLDNDDNTRWAAKGKGQYIILDLGAVQVLKKVLIKFFKGEERSANFDIALSVDGQNYVTGSANQNGGLVSEVSINPEMKARFVKFIGNGNDKNDWNSITSLEVFGTQSVGVETQPQNLPSDETDTSGPGKPIYDSNKDGKWNDGNAREIGKDESDGDIGPNGKGLFTAASGDPKFIIDGQGVGTLKTKPGFGRIYICVNNYNSLKELSFNIKSSSVDEMSLKSRSRHQAGGPCKNRFGGFGSTTSTEEVDFKTESCHNNHENGMTKALSKKLSLNTWYKTRYQVKDIQDNDNTVVQFTRWIDYDDGNGYVMVFQGTHPSPKDYYLDKAKFMEESMFWIRLNGSGEIAIKDLKIWDLDEPA